MKDRTLPVIIFAPRLSADSAPELLELLRLVTDTLERHYRDDPPEPWRSTGPDYPDTEYDLPF